jgi:oligopeptide transport system substrate-binding protein
VGSDLVPQPGAALAQNIACRSKMISARALWFALAALGMTILYACDSKSGHTPQEPFDAHLLRRGIGGEPASLDPGRAGDTFSFEVIRDLYEGLATETPSGEVQPGVAASWTTSPDGTVYTFILRPTARWSNGQAVRAQDFVNSWRRVVDPKHASAVADLLRPISHAAEIIAGKEPPTELGVFAPNDETLVVHLKQPAPYFLQVLTHTATFPIYSEEAAATHNSRDWVSNGPYVLTSWVPGSSISLTKNVQYWDRASVQIDRVRYLPIPDENSELNQYRAGQLEVTQSVPASALPLVKREYPNELLVAPFLGTAYYGINLHSTKFPLKVRQALTMAIDRKILENTILIFGQAPAYGFVPPGTSDYEPQFWQWRSLSNPERIAQARALYSSAGYSTSKPLRLRLLYNENPAIKRMSIAIASMWKVTLGIETDLIDEEYRVFLDSRKDTARWDIVRLGWSADYNDAGNFLEIFRSGSSNNDTGYSNADYDSLLDSAANSADASYRRHILEQAENLMLSEYPVVPVYYFSSKRLIKSYVKGAQSNPLNKLYSRHLSIQP